MKSAIFLTAALMMCAFVTRAQNVNYYILQSPTLAQAQTACQQYGFTMVSTVHAPDTYLVAMSASEPSSVVSQWVAGDPNVKNLSPNHKMVVPEVAPTTNAFVPSMPLTTYVTDPKLTALYGTTAWVGYVEQPAYYSTNASLVAPQAAPPGPAKKNPLTNAGIVAVIDTGVDQLNPILAPVVISGYDFTRNTAGFASDVADVNQSTAALLEQTSSAQLESRISLVLNQSTTAILEQSTAALLESRQPLPNDFGHGTMVAGLIHLVAPRVAIMPLKAFSADGTAQESDIIRAIYFATDHGASVINMSFELRQISDALMKAVNYAARKGVICVSSAGNDQNSALVYPAAFGNVISVASVNQSNQQSSFSNYGPDLVAVAAPGEALVTTYPGNHYAVGWGTSFSAALVSGGVMDMLNAANSNVVTQIQVGDVRRALSSTSPCGANGSLGAGCADFDQAANALKGLNLPKTN